MSIVAHDFHIPITRERDLRLFVRHAFGVEIPSKVHPDCEERHVSPWRAFCDAYFALEPVTVWKASRGFGGKSYLLALLGLTEAVTLKADVNILGGSGEQSQRVHEYCQSFWFHNSSPSHLLASDPSKRETRLTWGNYIRALMASSKSARGPHPQRLRLDEIDEMDLAILDAAMGQPMSKNGITKQTVMSSTHHYSDKTMSEVLERARAKGWPIYEWCYKETLSPTGWLPTDEVTSKQKEVTKRMWETEYELQEPNPASRAIDPSSSKRAFSKALGYYEGEVGEYIELEPPSPDGEYATGADWAKEQDFTVIVTLRTDVHPMRCVAFKRTRRRPWPAMIADFDTQCARFPGESCHDKTGLGGVVDDFVEDGMGVVLSRRTRQDLLTEYIAAIERNEIVYPFIAWAYREHRLASVEAVYGSGHLPDSICAGALAHKAAGEAVEIGRV